jgi:hypothetical protein
MTQHHTGLCVDCGVLQTHHLSRDLSIASERLIDELVYACACQNVAKTVLYGATQLISEQ